MTTTTTDDRGPRAETTAADLPELIAGIYRDALSDSTLDVDCDFFEAGGDSLVAFQITARLQAVLGIDLPVALVFAYPSPADLATVIDLDSGSEAG